MNEDDEEEEQIEDDLPPENIKLVNKKANKRANSNKKIDDEEKRLFWQRVFADPVGRREMWEFISVQCHGFSPPFGISNNGAPYREITWFNAGQYELGQRLYQMWLRIAGDGVLVIHDENDPNFKVEKKKNVPIKIRPTNPFTD